MKKCFMSAIIALLIAVVAVYAAPATKKTAPKKPAAKPSAASAKKPEVKKNALKVPDSGYWEVPCEFVNDYLLVEATFSYEEKVKGKKVEHTKRGKFLFDTGYAGYVTISQRFNMGVPSGVSGIITHTSVGTVENYKITRIKMGNLLIEGEELDASEDTVGIGGDDLLVDGLIGLSTWSKYVLEISYEKNYIRFHPREKTDLRKKPTDDEKTFLVKFDPNSPIRSILLPVKVNGHKARWILDTGACGSFVVIYQHSSKKWGVWEKDPKYLTGSADATGSFGAYQVWLKDIEIGNMKIPYAVATLLDIASTSQDTDGALGSDFWHAHNVWIDFRGRVMYLERYKDVDFGTPDGEPGCNAVMMPWGNLKGKTILYGIRNESPADKAGLKMFDVLLAIDDVPITPVNQRKVNDMLKGPIGSKVKLTVDKQGKVQNIELERKVLVNGTPPPHLDPKKKEEAKTTTEEPKKE